MDRKDFLRNACGMGICSCLGINLLMNESLSAAVDPQDESGKKTPVNPVDARQIQNLLSYIESTMPEQARQDIFRRLGAEHFSDPGYMKMIDNNKKDVKGFFGRINAGNSPYWEKIEYNPETSSIAIIGKPVDRCSCPYAQHENPPVSLCKYCCSGFHARMFEMLLGKPVARVVIDDSYLLGGKRCSATLHIEGKLQLD